MWVFHLVNSLRIIITGIRPTVPVRPALSPPPQWHYTFKKLSEWERTDVVVVGRRALRGIQGHHKADYYLLLSLTLYSAAATAAAEPLQHALRLQAGQQEQASVAGAALHLREIRVKPLEADGILAAADFVATVGSECVSNTQRVTIPLLFSGPLPATPRTRSWGQSF